MMAKRHLLTTKQKIAALKLELYHIEEQLPVSLTESCSTLTRKLRARKTLVKRSIHTLSLRKD